MEVDTDLSSEIYFVIVDNIVENYFDDDGNYVPQYGRMNIYRIFYNECVKSSKYDDTIPHDISKLDEIMTLMKDEDFVQELNKGMTVNDCRFDFANACKDALEIVNYKISIVTSIDTAVEKLAKDLSEFMSDIADDLVGFASQENIDNLAKVGQALDKGELDINQLVDDYGKSGRIKEIAGDNS